MRRKFNELYLEQDKNYKTRKEKLEKELIKNKNQNELLNNEKNTYTKENEEYKLTITRLKQNETELIRKIEELKRQSESRIKEMSADLNDIYNENKGLAKVVKRLFAELKEYKKEEGNFTNSLEKEEESLISEESKIVTKAEHKNKDQVIMEIGKNKVKVPTLDFTKLMVSLFSGTPQNFDFETFRGSKRLIRGTRPHHPPEPPVFCTLSSVHLAGSLVLDLCSS